MTHGYILYLVLWISLFIFQSFNGQAYKFVKLRYYISQDIVWERAAVILRVVFFFFLLPVPFSFAFVGSVLLLVVFPLHLFTQKYPPIRVETNNL